MSLARTEGVSPDLEVEAECGCCCDDQSFLKASEMVEGSLE